MNCFTKILDKDAEFIDLSNAVNEASKCVGATGLADINKLRLRINKFIYFAASPDVCKYNQDQQ